MNEPFNPSPQKQSRANLGVRISLAFADIRRSVVELARFGKVQQSAQQRVEAGDLHPAIVPQDEAFLSSMAEIPTETMTEETFLYGQRPAPLIEMPSTAALTADELADLLPGLSADGLFSLTMITGPQCTAMCDDARPRPQLRLEEGVDLLAVDMNQPMWLRRHNGGLPVMFASMVVCPSGLVHYELRQGMDANIVRTVVSRDFPGHEVRISGVVVRS